MKKINIRLFILVLCSLISIDSVADVKVTVDGLVYSLNGTKATIVDYTSDIPADLVIPETINYDGSQYEVSCIGNRQWGSSSWAKTGAFYNCTQLQSIVIPSSVTSILDGSGTDYSPELEGQVFYGCRNLKSVHFQGSTNIGRNAFYGCSSLKKIIFDSSPIINYGSFRNCTSLKYIVLPSGSEVNYDAFTGCDLIQNIICLGDDNVSLNLDNVNYINRKDFVKWDNYSYVYSGNNPVLPSFTNNMPAGFEVTSYDMSALEKDAGTYTQNVPFTFANNDISFDVEIPYTYTINPVTLTAKVKDASRLYGEANPQFATTYSGFVNNENASVVTSNGSYTTTATVKSDVGTYTIKQSGAKAKNYVFDYENGTLTVNKAPLTMTANDKTMIYGDKVPTLDAKYEGLKNNETQPVWNSVPQFSTTATSASKAGTYPITISNADAKNYEVTVNAGTMKVEKAYLTVRANSANRQYGEANPQFTLSYTGLKNNETVPEWEHQPNIGTTATVQSPVGTYPISITDAVAVNYDISTIEGTLTVNKAALQITPKNATRKYGEDNPTFELSYVGLKNNESEPEWTTAPAITTQATKTSSVGDYSIQVNSANARNYTITKKTGTLTITKAPLNIGVNSCTRRYGESNPQFGFYYSGLRNNETTPEWIQQPTISTAATQKSDVGEYAITATGGVMRNYETSGITAGVLTITPASLIIKADNASRLYFEDDPQFTYSCTGFVGNDNTSALTVKPLITTNAKKNSNVGVYAIEIGNAQSKNYTLSYQKGQLTVNKRQLRVSTNNYTREYGQENPNFELSYVGFVNNENENVLISKPKATTKATPYSDVGVYDITIDNGVAENYDFSYNTGKLTIEKAYQTLTWNQEFSDVKQYDQIELTATASSGLDVTYTVEGNQICSISRIGKKQYLDCTGEGEAVIVAIQEGNKNYWQTPKNSKQIVIKSSYVAVTYTLSISSGSGGMISYLGNSVYGTTKTYTVNEGAYPVLFFVPNAGYRIKSVVVNGSDVTSSVTDNQYIVSNISQNTTVSVEYVANKYRLTYRIDGVEYKTMELEYNKTITPEPAPSKEGYTFLGWSNIPATMPANDVTVTGSFSVNKYKLTYMIDDNLYKEMTYSYGATIVPEATPQGDYVSFEWNGVPTTMPAHDVTVTANYTIAPQEVSNMIDGHEYVDLGLPSGKCWATMNYGATTPEGYGSYLEWSYNNIISANWGSGWTTPSLQDIIELENNCTWTWGQKNGHNGYTITGKNGNSIFLPASGFQMSGQSSAKKVGDWVHYWTSTPSDDMAYTILSSSSGVAYGCTETTYSKLPIRPVTQNAIIVEVDDTDEYVDLGLPSGLLWATRNVGSNRPEEFGSYFAWGETTPKDSYSWDTYKYANGSNTSLTKYCTSYSYGKVDYIEVLEEKDDAATANWGKPWRTPTLIETQELINKCKWTSTTRNGVNGYTVTGPNGNSIFIPAAGIMVYNVPYITADACLQTATIFNADNGNPASASVLYIEKGTPHKWYGWDRCWGYSVRPVMSADQTKIPVASADVENVIIGIYDLRGHKLDNLQKGINIVKYKNGEFKKVSK